MVSFVNSRTQKEDWKLDTGSAGKPGMLQAFTASVAKSVLREEQRKGNMQEVVTLVDKRMSVPEEYVKFGGKIIYVDKVQHIADIVEDIWMMLVLKSPIGDPAQKRFGKAAWRRKHYHKVHSIFYNRKSVQPENLEKVLRNAKPGDEISIVNLLPYAKRIEYGKGKHNSRDRKRLLKTPRKSITAWSSQAPHGVYRQVAKTAARKYGRRSWIKYRLVRAPEIGYSFKDWTKTGAIKVEQRYPAIMIRVSKLTKTG